MDRQTFTCVACCKERTNGPINVQLFASLASSKDLICLMIIVLKELSIAVEISVLALGKIQEVNEKLCCSIEIIYYTRNTWKKLL